MKLGRDTISGAVVAHWMSHITVHTGPEQIRTPHWANSSERTSTWPPAA